MPDDQSLRDVPVLKPHVRLTGPKRAAYRFAAARAYRHENSIKAIAERSGRSPGFVRTVLTEAQVVFRKRGRRERKHARV
ncbi:helix-turn-helix domain-containing protein [Streptomyces hygroscopicus]|uniref:helix-turn-helix domain-containing protein n=1 Tax=Streptomyces hygroscopicus TaxID=1912 RepID=UPI001FCC6E9A|nr:helix-turn-helix domain-containing protein [Streptomyces hygroscopicus]BDH10519.1 hypothetical protein HOK021_16980 [Streptomyces hygroscopicus]